MQVIPAVANCPICSGPVTAPRPALAEVHAVPVSPAWPPPQPRPSTSHNSSSDHVLRRQSKLRGNVGAKTLCGRLFGPSARLATVPCKTTLGARQTHVSRRHKWLTPVEFSCREYFSRSWSSQPEVSMPTWRLNFNALPVVTNCKDKNRCI